LEDWLATQQVLSEADCKQSYSVPKTKQNPQNHHTTNDWSNNLAKPHIID
jgi:hypothetical protein